MATTPAPAVNKQRFARLISRMLTSARGRGMTDKDIAAATSIGESTFHRWRRGDFEEAPKVAKIAAFCEGLGESLSEALTALGVHAGRDNPEPEPPLPPDVKIILRRLADPGVPERDKLVIREMLRMLANQPPQPGGED